MAIVSRRTLQRLLHENAKVLTPAQTGRHVQTLNGGGAPALAAECEILVINGLGRLGLIEHEPRLAGRSRPDVLFRLLAAPDYALIADITTVSDAGTYDENPLEEFSQEFGHLLVTNGLTASGFVVHVEGSLSGASGRQKMRLDLPPKGADLRRVVRRDLGPFVRSVREDPSRPRRTALSAYDVKISYRPGQYGMTAGYPTFTVPYSLDKNPLMNALKSKAEQLRRTDFDGVRGVFVCDGDCAAASAISQTLHGCAATFTPDQIVRAFLGRRTSMSFVWMVTVTEPLPPYPRKPRRFEAKLFLNPKAKNPCSADQVAALQRLVTVMPSPARIPANALRFLRSKTPLPDSSYNSFDGGVTMSSKEIRLSSRTLVRLLAGRISIDEFLRNNHLAETEHAIPFFENQVKAGRMLVSARVERVPESDDDWVVLEFGEADPAIGPFRTS